jgi:hypothetical protein
MSYADMAADVEKGNMGQAPLVAGTYPGELVKLETKKNPTGGQTVLIKVLLDEDVTPPVMASREVELRYNLEYAFGIKRLLQLLMRVGMDVKSWTKERQERSMSKALKLLDLAEPKCTLAIHYAWDKQTGKLKRSKKGYPITNTDVVDIDTISNDYDPSVMELPDTSKIDFEQPSDEELKVDAPVEETPAAEKKSKPSKQTEKAKKPAATKVTDPIGDDEGEEDPYGV